MDLLKTMLLYMSITFATAVQGADLPVTTPEPTAIVVETATIEPWVVTATPEPTASPRPVAEITPNRAYHNLTMKSKGDAVKQLQRRLIELGYLAEGNADGVYGGKTRNAVIKFQKYNGLTPDGIAGRQTQTYLFEHPDINYCPTEPPVTEPPVTPEPPAETPAPAETTPEA